MHAFQTAEGIREKHPDKEWFQVAGLIHDIGKVMSHWGEPQWSTVGDTFPVGCAPDDTIVFGVESFKDNPDIHDEKLNTKLGIYEENCGLDNVFMSWGHDEYLYRVLQHNGHNLPDEALYMIRFHSFYPWHTSGAYNYLCTNKDLEMLPWIREFNKFDLYTKRPDMLEVDELVPYYTKLVDKYVPGKIKFWILAHAHHDIAATHLYQTAYLYYNTILHTMYRLKMFFKLQSKKVLLILMHMIP